MDDTIHFRSALRTACAITALLVLAGCESSTRLSSLLPDGTRAGSAVSAPQAPPPPLTAAPSAGEVESSALPPPAGAPQLAAPGPGTPVTSPPPSPAPSVGTAPGNLPAPPPQTAAPSPGPVASAAPSRTAMTGNWSLTESAGARCRVTLSSAPKLDLYGAGTNGCQAKELQRVNAWELSGSEVILYEPGGGVVARLRQAGEGTFTGVSTRSGAPVSMSK